MKKKLLALLMGTSMVLAACGGGGDGGGKESASADPEKMYQQKCSGCHGGDLKGGAGTDLTKVGSHYSKDEIKDIIENGKGGGMPAGLYKGDDADKVAGWLAEKK
ncbi:cytochrome c [Neobacillus notoginsengisoli]|uniref:Cytochrome c n=1 Tax=Neobacillus notoginsengisoli TaxID=1578198 RepID=A0A417YR76_9BACI|nr:cytochrome c [Neobacillus notoginsengisoli]RHW37354.1 cytochrome c [Neobacillus notoginsengisoli]